MQTNMKYQVFGVLVLLVMVSQGARLRSVTYYLIYIYIYIYSYLEMLQLQTMSFSMVRPMIAPAKTKKSQNPTAPKPLLAPLREKLSILRNILEVGVIYHMDALLDLVIINIIIIGTNDMEITMANIIRSAKPPLRNIYIYIYISYLEMLQLQTMSFSMVRPMIAPAKTKKSQNPTAPKPLLAPLREKLSILRNILEVGVIYHMDALLDLVIINIIIIGTNDMEITMANIIRSAKPPLRNIYIYIYIHI